MPVKRKNEKKEEEIWDQNKEGGLVAKNILLMAAVGIILLVVGGTGGYLLNKKLHQEEPIVDNTPAQVEDSEVEEEGTSEEENQVVDGIEWNRPQQIESLSLFESINIDFNREADAKYYKLGKFIEGVYKDGEIILVSAMAGEMSPGSVFYRFVKKGEQLTLLKKYSGEIYNGDGFKKSKFNIDESYTIPSLDFPKFIYGEKPRQILEINSDAGISFNPDEFFDANNLQLAFVDKKWGNVYTQKDVFMEVKEGTVYKNGFYLKSPDGTVRVYILKPDFIGEHDEIPAITWTNGEKNKDRYYYVDSSGCGSWNFISVVDRVTHSSFGLREIGKNSKGDKIYEITDSKHPLLKEAYERNHIVFDGAESKEVSYEEFLVSRPLIFWEDPFGRLIKLENQKFAPIAECGKPVIYLYPEKTTKISVKVEPKGGMSYSDPEYNNGWEVISDTNSNIIELSSGKVYPYLFWEGRGGIYEQPQNGFVVSQQEVHGFLVEKLAKFGLNKKETADFIEFWEPRMQAAPYYFVTFLGNEGMNRLAPLAVDPKPDTIIRILMDFSPLEKPINVKGYEIRTPERKGFTVVEWGGVLR